MDDPATERAEATPTDHGIRPEVTARQAGVALLVALAFVALTRWPVMRTEPFESDEFIFVRLAGEHWFDSYHTLYVAAARLAAVVAGDRYRAYVYVNFVTSAAALAAVWWWLRALVRPATAAAAALLLGLAPLFWAYGAVAGNYTMIAAVGAALLGVAARSGSRGHARRWHPYAAAAALAVGTGYRHDVGMLWLPVFLVVVWRHRWAAGLGALAAFTALNLAWLVPMLVEAGGWHAFRASTREFAYNAGYLNSVWNLGFVDAPLRYAVKLAAALAWTFGPALLLAPRGLLRLARRRDGGPGPGREWDLGSGPGLAALLALSVVPPLALHLTVHFGVPGYAMHYVPALAALIALGAGRAGSAATTPSLDRAPARLAALGAVLAAVFLFYPTDYARPGLRGDFDLAFARHTRVGIRTPLPVKTPASWRTSNSRPADPRTARR